MRDMAKLQSDMKATERAHKAWNSEDVQWLVGIMREDFEILDHAPLRQNMRKAVARNTKLDAEEKLVRSIQVMGLDRPETHEDELRIYIAIKAVVRYWEAKLSTLEAQSLKHEKTKERIHELGINGGIRNHGSVPVR